MGRWKGAEGERPCRSQDDVGHPQGQAGAQGTAWPPGWGEVCGHDQVSRSFELPILQAQADFPHSEGPTSLDQEQLPPAAQDLPREPRL